MLESRCQVPHRTREIGVDTVAGGPRRRGVVRFVEDQERRGIEIAKPVAEWRRVGFVAQQRVRDDEPRVRRPRIDAEAALPALPHHVVAIQHLERQSEARVHFVAPLQHHGWRRGDDDASNLLPNQQLANDQAGFNRLAETHVVGDEQVDAGEQQRLSQRLELVRVDLDSRSVGRLEQLRVGGGNGVPAQRVQVGRKCSRIVEPSISDTRPRIGGRGPRVDLGLPQHF